MSVDLPGQLQAKKESRVITSGAGRVCGRDRPEPGGRTKTARNLGTSYSMVATIRVGAIRLRVIAAPTGAKGSAKCPPPRFWTVSFVSHAKGVVSQPRCSDGVR